MIPPDAGKLVYLASPYSHDDPTVRQARFEAAVAATCKLLALGQATFSPIVHSHHLAGHGLPGSWEFWGVVDRELLLRCDSLAVLKLDGWEQSIGVQAEMALAMNKGMPVWFVAPDVE